MTASHTPIPTRELEAMRATLDLEVAAAQEAAADCKCFYCQAPLLRAKEKILLLDEIRSLRAALKDAATTLVECANIIRPDYPSLADNVILTCAKRCHAALLEDAR